MMEDELGGGIFDLGGPPTPPGPPAPMATSTSPATAESPPPSAPSTAPASPAPSPSVTPTDTAELRQLIREATSTPTPLRLIGAGRWLDAGRPVLADHSLCLGALTGIIEYVPGDLTITARAGTTLASLQAVAAAEGQFLPLDPWGGDDGTLGATLATASAGPGSGAFGLPRDVVLGVSFVTGTGELVHAGGRVVKNVAGFDLVRLTVGAWGTLGAITEATVRLRALPERDETVSIPLGPGADLASLLQKLRSAPIRPVALELLDPSLARQLGLGDTTLVLARLAGNSPSVDGERRSLASLGDLVDAPTSVWTRLREEHRPADTARWPAGAVLRLSAPPAHLHELWSAAQRILDAAATARAQLPTLTPPSGGLQAPPGVAHASVARGVVRLLIPPLPEDSLSTLLADGQSPVVTRIFERLPAALWPTTAPSAVAHPLARGVRLAFDPEGILNPGILGAEWDDAPGAAASPGGPS